MRKTGSPGACETELSGAGPRLTRRSLRGPRVPCFAFEDREHGARVDEAVSGRIRLGGCLLRSRAGGIGVAAKVVRICEGGKRRHDEIMDTVPCELESSSRVAERDVELAIEGGRTTQRDRDLHVALLV